MATKATESKTTEAVPPTMSPAQAEDIVKQEARAAEAREIAAQASRIASAERAARQTREHEAKRREALTHGIEELGVNHRRTRKARGRSPTLGAWVPHSRAQPGARQCPPAPLAERQASVSATLARAQALAHLVALAHGLSADEGGRLRLLERVAAQDEPEKYRALLSEMGAGFLLARASEIPE